MLKTHIVVSVFISTAVASFHFLYQVRALSRGTGMPIL
jgi:hypothetical protein